MANRELKKGSAELLILSLLATHGPRHGYELSRLIEARSAGTVRFNVASLYPVLYRLEKKRWVRANWVEKAGQRRRRYYRITEAGATVLKEERRAWEAFVGAVSKVIGPEPA